MFLRLATLSLLLLYPVAWAAPLMRAGVLPLFGLAEISVLTGIRSLWSSDIFLALVVALFALIAPYAKLLGLVAVQWRLAPHRLLVPLHGLSRLAMADIFLIALYITLAKGIGVGRVETAWGLYLFTFCILASLALGRWTERSMS
ncbi:MAG: paraquat-inducible membrane protein A [Rhodobacteraceae bacterium]|nr:paraquat-inducible membrane protein A [Paracoccaceae bacterium]